MSMSRVILLVVGLNTVISLGSAVFGYLSFNGHLGGTAGYRSFVGRVRPLRVTMTFALNAQEDPTPLVIPAVQALAAADR